MCHYVYSASPESDIARRIGIIRVWRLRVGMKRHFASPSGLMELGNPILPKGNPGNQRAWNLIRSSDLSLRQYGISNAVVQHYRQAIRHDREHEQRSIAVCKVKQ